MKTHMRLKAPILMMLFAMCPALSACVHSYDYEEEGVPALSARPNVTISEDITIKISKEHKDYRLLSVMQNSGYFTSLYIGRDKKDVALTFIARVDEETVNSTAQTLGSIPGILTLGVAPISLTKKVTLNIAVYKGEKFFKRYRPSAVTEKGVALWQVLDVNHKTVMDELLYQFVSMLRVDLDRNTKH